MELSSRELAMHSSSVSGSDWSEFCCGGAVHVGAEDEGVIAAGFLEIFVTSFLKLEWGVWLFVILPGVLKDSIDWVGDLVAVLRGDMFI